LAFREEGRLCRCESLLSRRNPVRSVYDPRGLLPFLLSFDTLGAGLGTLGTGCSDGEGTV
jgi:hypothetical protein